MSSTRLVFLAASTLGVANGLLLNNPCAWTSPRPDRAVGPQRPFRRAYAPVLGPRTGDAFDDPDEISALDLSRELSKRLDKSKGLRLRTSGPVRKGVGAVDSLVRQVQDFGRFISSAVTAVPFHVTMMITLLLCYGLQSWCPKAAMMSGARVNAAIRAGQWHRLVSPVFLHGGFAHLASNLFSLWRVGPLVEAAFGVPRTALLYLLSGLGGNLAGLWFGASRGMSIGASGAVFGMIGATGGYVMRKQRALGTYGDMLLRNAGSMLLINLYIGSRRGSGIDNLAHVGGFATGAVLAALLAPKVSYGYDAARTARAAGCCRHGRCARCSHQPRCCILRAYARPSASRRR